MGMGKELVAEVPAARELFERANSILGYDLAQLCFEGPAGELDSTVHSQPALFVCSLAALAPVDLVILCRQETNHPHRERLQLLGHPAAIMRVRCCW